jgi:uncharacterized protein (TIGR03118 family)
MSGLNRTFVLGIVSLFVMNEVRADPILQTNLVSNQSGVAKITDAALVNPWGISSSPTSPFWVSNNGIGTATLYSVTGTDNPTKLGLTVTIPGDGSVTGQVNTFGGLLNAFNGDNFLFVSEDGTISGWRGALGTNAERFQVADTANVYKGSAFANVGGHSYLYSANFRSGAIDVLKGDTGAPNLTGNFTDPGLPSGFAPFNIQKLGNFLYVTYAKQDAAKHEEVTGAGLGFVSKFDLNGNFLGRVAGQGTLNAPWGLAIAPTGYGSFAGDLLVGNFGDGRINVYDSGTNAFLGQLSDLSGNPIAIDGLWGLIPGNGASGGNANEIYFTAGPNDEANGIFGALVAVPEPSQAVLVAAFLVVAFGAGFGRRLAIKRSAGMTSPR